MAFDQIEQPRARLGQAARLDAALRDADPATVIAAAVDAYGDRLALVSSFGAESAVLLHMASQIDRSLPVIFIDTGKHFWGVFLKDYKPAPW